MFERYHRDTEHKCDGLTESPYSIKHNVNVKRKFIQRIHVKKPLMRSKNYLVILRVTLAKATSLQVCLQDARLSDMSGEARKAQSLDQLRKAVQVSANAAALAPVYKCKRSLAVRTDSTSRTQGSSSSTQARRHCRNFMLASIMLHLTSFVVSTVMLLWQQCTEADKLSYVDISAQQAHSVATK